MDWIEICVQADGEAAEAVSELFNRLNSRPDGQGGAVTEVGGFDPVGEDHHPLVLVKTYLPSDDPGTPERQRQIEEGLWYLGRVHPLGEPQIRTLVEEDWANTWKASYQPLRIGRRFLVIPAWQANDVAGTSEVPGTLRIILDPGMAFGTGLHPSTQLCMAAMEDVVQGGDRVLDAGCGSGILSIAAVRLGAGSVDAFDIDPIAMRATEENAALNDLPVAIHAVISAGPDETWTRASTWDVILVNILPHVIIALLDAGLHTYLAPAGRMILAGIIEEREPDVRAALGAHGLRVTQRLADSDWVALVARPIPQETATMNGLSDLYPILEYDPTPEAVIEPRKLIKPIDAPERCVICFFQEVIARLAEEGQIKLLSTRKSEIGAHPVYELAVEGQRLALFHPGVGAPLAAALLDEVIALGCRKFIACGGAGVLNREIAVGHIVVPTSAVRDEGTSYHYLPPSREVVADPRGVAAIETALQAHHVPYVLGKTWTTDAFYRETVGKVERRRAEGCLTVEMEAAAFFAVARFRGATFGQMLYGGDDVSGAEWDHRGWGSHQTIREKLFWLAVEACLVL